MRNRMMLLGEILSLSFLKKDRDKIELQMKRGNFSFGKKVDWEKFQVYKSSVNRIKVLLFADISFILAVCDSVDESQTVKIAVMLTEEESSVSCLKTGEGETLAMIAINRRQYRRLSRGIKMQ